KCLPRRPSGPTPLRLPIGCASGRAPRPPRPFAEGARMWKSFGWCVALVALLVGCSGEPDGAPKSTKGSDGIDLQLLDPALQPLRRDFEDAYGHIRLVAVLSSTCSDCLENSRRLYRTAIEKLEAKGVEVFFVWGSPLPPD